MPMPTNSSALLHGHTTGPKSRCAPNLNSPNKVRRLVRWRQLSLPVLFAQLAACTAIPLEKDEHSWRYLCAGICVFEVPAKPTGGTSVVSASAFGLMATDAPGFNASIGYSTILATYFSHPVPAQLVEVSKTPESGLRFQVHIQNATGEESK
ncbi:hypothetical protein [Elongatibacter sediminis]|uniref:Uncharacterized protein n=1 Tax=Elongatibacter sediminis TaxID=3119006 RepID=A0AAW9RC62_9GAMM